MQSGALTGGMVVSRALARYGSRTVFALAGASHTHLLDAHDRDGFTIVGGRAYELCLKAGLGTELPTEMFTELEHP